MRWWHVGTSAEGPGLDMWAQASGIPKIQRNARKPAGLLLTLAMPAKREQRHSHYWQPRRRCLAVRETPHGAVKIGGHHQVLPWRGFGALNHHKRPRPLRQVWVRCKECFDLGRAMATGSASITTGVRTRHSVCEPLQRLML